MAETATKSPTRFHKRSSIRLFCAFVGIILGAAIYLTTDFRVLYKLSEDGRLLTLSQPRLTQALAEIATPFPEAPVKKVLVFGGSGAYHAISPDFVEAELAKAGVDVDVGLVSFASQSFVDLFAMIEALPERPDVTDIVVLPWSFWRFDGELLADLNAHFSFNRSFFRSRVFEDRLNAGAFDGLIDALTPHASWRALSEAEGLPRRNRLYNWVSYFLLDKFLKIKAGRWAYLFKDPPAFLSAGDLSDRSVTRYNKILLGNGHIDRLNGQLGKLDTKGTRDFTIRDPGNLGPTVRGIFQQLAGRLKEKGYTFILYELPVYETRLRESPFVGYADETRNIVENSSWSFPTIAFESSRFPLTLNGVGIDADTFAWHDYIHVSKIGARVVSSDFAASIEPYARAENR